MSLLARTVAATAAGGRESRGCQGHHLLWRESRALIDQVVIDRDTESLDGLPRAEAMECQFNVGTGDGGEVHGRLSAPRRTPRKPGSYIFNMRLSKNVDEPRQITAYELRFLNSANRVSWAALISCVRAVSFAFSSAVAFGFKSG